MNRQDVLKLAEQSGLTDKDLGKGMTDYGDASNSIYAFAALIAEDCAKRCDEEVRIRTDAGNKFPEDSDSRVRCFAAARAAINCAASIREAYKP